jgi:pyruvate,water dikinase
VRGDAAAEQAVRGQPPERLAEGYRAGTLPPVLQAGLAAFLRRYGHRGVAEIDLGLARWADDPTHILGALANYLQLDDPERAPDAQFRRAAEQAEAMAAELARRAARRSPIRGWLVRFCFSRARGLAGLREMPKFQLVAALAQARALLRPVGEALARAGSLAAPDDVYFLTLAEARVGLAGADLRPLVRERRASYERELQRRRVPRILLSDGTEPGAEGAAPTRLQGDGGLRGAPASAGVVTARARVITRTARGWSPARFSSRRPPIPAGRRCSLLPADW